MSTTLLTMKSYYDIFNIVNFTQTLQSEVYVMDEKRLQELATYIPEYWTEYLEGKIAQIQENQIKAGPDSMSFGIISDIHWRTNCFHSAALLEKVMTDCSIPYFFNAGDLFSGQGICTPEENIAEFINYRKLFARIEHKCLIAEGNHDAVYSTFEAPDYYAQNIPLAQFYEYYFRFESLYHDRVFGENGTYYYVDDKLHKTRLVVLNTHDIPDDSTKEEGRPVYHKFRASGSGLLQRQINWFANVALDVPTTDWTVVLCTHETVAEYKCQDVCNYTMLVEIINAFKKHTSYEGDTKYEGEQAHYCANISVDYTGRGGNFAVWVGGHSHCDKDMVYDGILSVATVNDGMHNSESNPFKHVEGTTTEQAFDIYTIDKKNHKLYVTRIGCGEDREFEYEVF